jgi:hypothetical protein
VRTDRWIQLAAHLRPCNHPHQARVNTDEVADRTCHRIELKAHHRTTADQSLVFIERADARDAIGLAHQAPSAAQTSAAAAIGMLVQKEKSARSVAAAAASAMAAPVATVTANQAASLADASAALATRVVEEEKSGGAAAAEVEVRMSVRGRGIRQIKDRMVIPRGGGRIVACFGLRWRESFERCGIAFVMGWNRDGIAFAWAFFTSRYPEAFLGSSERIRQKCLGMAWHLSGSFFLCLVWVRMAMDAASSLFICLYNYHLGGHLLFPG